MNYIDLITIDLTFDGAGHIRWSPHQLRGALGNLYPNDALFHQHDNTGNVLYRYPRVHYRRTDRGAQVAGFAEGIQALTTVSWPGLTLRLGERNVTVLEAESHFLRHHVCFTEELIRYRFGSPWLPFNSEILRRYGRLTPAAQAPERDRLARAGLLVALKELNVWVQERVVAAVEVSGQQNCHYKDVSMLGFRGVLLTNLDLPNGFAIGRAVSHGYGWITRHQGESS